MTTSAISGKRIGFIGFGQMAQSLAHRLANLDMLPGEILFSRRNDKPVSFMDKLLTGATNHEVVQRADIIFLAIKPHQAKQILADLQFREDQIIISVLAGVDLEWLLENAAPARVVRTMPNLAVKYGSGIVAFQCDPSFSEAGVSELTVWFDVFGLSLSVIQSADFDAITAVAGSGPAFSFVFAQAMSDAAVREGLSRMQAERLVSMMLAGVADLLHHGDVSPETWKDRVASPRGTTIEGLRAIEAGGFRSAVFEAVAASAERSRELMKGQNES